MAVREVKHNRGEELNAENLRAALGNRPVPRRFLLIRPYFSKGCLAQRPVREPRRSRPLRALIIIQAWPSRKLGSQPLSFHHLAPIDETMLQLNSIINGWYSRIRNQPIVIFHCIF